MPRKPFDATSLGIALFVRQPSVMVNLSEIDVALFNEQRHFIQAILSGRYGKVVEPKEMDYFDGINNLFDAIADQLHDVHALPIFMEDDEEEVGMGDIPTNDNRELPSPTDT